MMNPISSKFYAGTIFRLLSETGAIIRVLLDNLFSLIGIIVFIVNY